MIIEQPEWLPQSQESIGTALNHAAVDWASGDLMSVAIFAETTGGHVKIWATEPEDLLRMMGFLTAFVNYISHQVPFDGDELEDDMDEDDDVNA